MENNYIATLCFYRYLPCFLHEIPDEPPMLIGIDWYFETLLSAIIWVDLNIFKIKKLPLIKTQFKLLI